MLSPKQAPPRSGIFRPKMRYAHQGGRNPPIVVIHGNALEKVPDSYRRYLEHTFREVFKLQGTPLRIQFNVSEKTRLLIASRRKRTDASQSRKKPRNQSKVESEAQVL